MSGMSIYKEVNSVKQFFVGFLFFMMAGICVTYAQLTNQDCLNAIPVCQNTYVQPNSYSGKGSDTLEINPLISCLNAGERNDVWYIFTVSVSGTLNFSLFPNNSNNDYDFALYNLTNNNCNDIRTNPGLEVACNFSGNIAGCGGITGANGNTTGTCGLMNANTVAVTAGQTYVLNVSNYSQTQQNGYTLDFSASSATIYDNIPPLLNTVSPLSCGADTINLVFNENMLFSSFQPSDFTLTGPGGTYNITSITAPNCTNGSAYDKNYHFTFSPAITMGGTYTFSIVGNVTDICSNPIATPTTRSINVAGITVNPSSTNVSCNGANDGTATVTVVTGTGPFTYQWSNNVSTTNTAINLPVNIYVVTVSAPNSCPATATYNITQAPSMADSALVITPATCGANNGALSLYVTGGTSPYSYLWSNGSTSLNQTNLAAGNYTLTVTDNKNCMFSKMFTVGTLSTLNSVPQIQNINCYGDNTGSITLNTTGGSGNYTFQWSGGISTTNSVSNLTAGTYTATVMDGACLIVFSNLTVTQPSAALTATISSTQTTCGNSDGTATVSNVLGGTATYTYLWNNGNTAAAISNLASGTYTCTITDANGCTLVKTTNVSPSNGHTVTINYLNDTVTCFGWSDGGIALNVSGGVTPYAYQWSGGLPPNSSQNSLSAGTYTATVTDATGCSITVSATIDSPPAINLNLVNSTNVLCYGNSTGAATVSASGGTGTLTYLWSPAGGTNASATNIAAGNYTVTVTDVKGCNASLPVTITQPALAFTNINAVTQTFCGNSNGAISTAASGGTSPYIYLWNNGATSTSISNLAPGSYTVTITDNNGCTLQQTETINASTPVSILVNNLTNVLCNGNANGAINVSSSGGVTPYSYVWSNGFTGNNNINLSAGIYTVSVSDAVGCSATISDTITEPPALSVITSPSSITCMGQTTLLSPIYGGGSLPYSYVWSNGATSASINVSPSITTTYTVTITDANGCTNSDLTTLSIYDAMVATLPTDTNVCQGNLVLLAPLVTGGDGNYIYNWNTGTNLSYENITATNDSIVSVYVTDGCNLNPVTLTVSIQTIPTPVIDYTFDVNEGCEPLTVSFTSVVTAVAGSSYLWNFGDDSTSEDADPVHTFYSGAVYHPELIVTTPAPYNCIGSFTTPDGINVLNIPVAAFDYTPEKPTVLNSTVLFYNNTQFASSYQWSFGDGASSTASNPEHYYPLVGTYPVTLIASNNGMCFDTLTIELQIREAYSFYVPEGFTPNGDGKNDVLQFKAISAQEISVTIFNRWGQLVFEDKGNPVSWNGSVNNGGETVQKGSYVYIADVVDDWGKKHRLKGTVSVIK